MEGHEVPKNVTEFEFHLVGDMTLKQFAYLASGLGIAYLIFVGIASSLPLLAWPLIFVTGGAGAAYAFLPISERPLDHWTTSFFRAIFAPTERAWKSKIFPKDSPDYKNRFQLYLSSISDSGTISQTTTKSSVISKFTQTNLPSTPSKIEDQQPKPQSSIDKQPPPIQKTDTNLSPLPSPEELKETVELAKQAQVIQNQIIHTEKVLEEIRAKAATPGVDPKQYQDQLKQTQLQLQKLTNEASKISHYLAVLAKTPEVFKGKKVSIPARIKPTDIKIVLTTTPNIINGIVTDSQGNYLEGVIVVTHDKEGLPVRALKTNKLGQFLAATPLPNGIYTITLEKDDLTFDVLEVKLEGQVMSAIKVAAKRAGSINLG